MPDSRRGRLDDAARWGRPRRWKPLRPLLEALRAGDELLSYFEELDLELTMPDPLFFFAWSTWSSTAERLAERLGLADTAAIAKALHAEVREVIWQRVGNILENEAARSTETPEDDL